MYLPGCLVASTHAPHMKSILSTHKIAKSSTIFQKVSAANKTVIDKTEGFLPRKLPYCCLCSKWFASLKVMTSSEGLLSPSAIKIPSKSSMTEVSASGPHCCSRAISFSLYLEHPALLAQHCHRKAAIG